VTQASLRTLPQDLGRVFGPQGNGDEDQIVRDFARNYSTRLKERALEELPLLPFGGVPQAQALIDAMNARCDVSENIYFPHGRVCKGAAVIIKSSYFELMFVSSSGT
jgi:hypothetical protein